MDKDYIKFENPIEGIKSAVMHRSRPKNFSEWFTKFCRPKQEPIEEKEQGVLIDGLDSSTLKVGNFTQTGYILEKKIESLDELWIALESEKSIFWRHGMKATAFIQNIRLRTALLEIKRGKFFIANKK